MSTLIHNLTTIEDSGFSLMARIQGVDAANIVQADISSIAYSIFDLADPTSATDTGSLTVASVVFDALQTDARWSEDETGYNFRWDVPASIPATGTKRYRFEIAFTPGSGEVFHALFESSTIALHRS
jgi:hypothetical protein